MVEVDSGVVVVVVVIIAEVIGAVVVERTNTQANEHDEMYQLRVYWQLGHTCVGKGVYVRIWCFSQPAN